MNTRGGVLLAGSENKEGGRSDWRARDLAGGFLFSGVAGEYVAAAPLFVSFQDDLIISSSSSLTIPEPKRLERLEVLTHNTRLASGRGQQRLPPPQ